VKLHLIKGHRRGLVLGVAMLALVLGTFAWACGSDSAAPAADVCDGASCDGASTSGDGAAVGQDGNPVADGRSPEAATGDAGDAGRDAAISVACADASAGSLDPAFGDGGFALLPYGSAPATPTPMSAAVQADGKIVLGGSYSESFATANKNFAVFRFKPDFTVDTGFADGGLAQTLYPGGGFGALGASAVTVDPSGRILAAGKVAPTGNHIVFGVVRYTTDGAVDPSFGNAGVTLVDFGVITDLVTSIAVLPDGRILVSGTAGVLTSAGGSDYAVARLDANGTLDPTFGSGGKAMVDVRSSIENPGVMAVQPDGKILIAGGSTQEPARLVLDLSVVRLMPNGALDATFATGGKLVATWPGSTSAAGGVAVDAAGRIVLVGGFSDAAHTNDAMVLRLTPAGTFDVTFGTGGLVTTDFGGQDGVGWTRLQPDGKIVAAGGTVAVGGASSSLLAARYKPDGTLDPSFGAAGKFVTPFPGFPIAPGNPAVFHGCALTFFGRLNVGPSFFIAATRFRID
jgi:uncharacterized delta-60 repeat protein